jgi:hypothetical protein
VTCPATKPILVDCEKMQRVDKKTTAAHEKTFVEENLGIGISPKKGNEIALRQSV